MPPEIMTKAEEQYFETAGEEAPADDEKAADETAEAEEKSAGEAAGEEEEKPEAKGRTVPLSELLSERKKRQELDRRLQEEAEKRERLAGRIETLAELVQKSREGPPPDQYADPEGYQKWQERQQKEREQQRDREFEKLRRWREQQEQAARQAQATREIMARCEAAVAEFSSKAPDFRDAYQYVAGVRDRDLKAMGFTDPAVRREMLLNEEWAVVNQAFREGHNPAELIYAYAKERGYKPGASKGGDLEKIAEGRRAARSLGAAAGKTPSRPTLERLAEMSDEEFAEATKGDKWRKLFT